MAGATRFLMCCERQGKHMKNILSIVIALTLLAGCATKPAPDVVTYYDQTTRIRTDLIPENLLESPQDPPRELLWLNASRVFKDYQDFDYYLDVQYTATTETGFLDIAAGESLVIVADDKQLKLQTTGSSNMRRTKGDVVSEKAIYLTSADDLRAIAYAKKVQVHVIGRNGRVVREFAPENFERFKKFVHHYVEGGR
jgi:hypothetical protein